jgi:hypothetical protein
MNPLPFLPRSKSMTISVARPSVIPSPPVARPAAVSHLSVARSLRGRVGPQPDIRGMLVTVLVGISRCPPVVARPSVVVVGPQPDIAGRS